MLNLSQEDLDAIEGIVERVVDSMEKRLISKMNMMEKRLKNRITRHDNRIVDHFDKVTWEHGKRIIRLENHSNLPPIKFD